ncbi:unnamed protein product [Acanthosepion pharaonis]|uniref:Uncharacterized protein n=1 Tax=Acanthosepion pharaonis TaxID=158019 RepID=A0A812CIT2_ACAPH|nr:unnamed protein product [Sepia pharaonis]
MQFMISKESKLALVFGVYKSLFSFLSISASLIFFSFFLLHNHLSCFFLSFASIDLFVFYPFSFSTVHRIPFVHVILLNNILNICHISSLLSSPPTPSPPLPQSVSSSPPLCLLLPKLSHPSLCLPHCLLPPTLSTPPPLCLLLSPIRLPTLSTPHPLCLCPYCLPPPTVSSPTVSPPPLCLILPLCLHPHCLLLPPLSPPPPLCLIPHSVSPHCLLPPLSPPPLCLLPPFCLLPSNSLKSLLFNFSTSFSALVFFVFPLFCNRITFRPFSFLPRYSCLFFILL